MITSLISFHESPLPINRPQELQQLKINIISGKKDNIQELFQKLKQRFGIDLNENNLNLENNFNNQINIQSRNKKLVIEVELISMKSGYMLRPQKYLTMFSFFIAFLHTFISFIIFLSCLKAIIKIFCIFCKIRYL